MNFILLFMMYPKITTERVTICRIKLRNAIIGIMFILVKRVVLLKLISLTKISLKFIRQIFILRKDLPAIEPFTNRRFPFQTLLQSNKPFCNPNLQTNQTPNSKSNPNIAYPKCKLDTSSSIEETFKKYTVVGDSDKR
jgi:hypothetical protein